MNDIDEHITKARRKNVWMCQRMVVSEEGMQK